MFRSIRWTLQMWHAAILATVLIVFSWVVYYLMRETTYQQIDAGLERMSDLVAAGVRPVGGRFRRPPRLRDSSRPEPAPGVREPSIAKAPAEKGSTEKNPADKVVVDRGEGDRPSLGAERKSSSGRRGPSEPGTRAPVPLVEIPGLPALAIRRNPRPEVRLELNEDFPKFFEEEQEAGSTAYFVLWRADGHVSLASPSAAEVPLPELHPEPHAKPFRFFRQRGNFRELIHQWRPDRYLLVGRSIEADIAGLHDRAWLLAGINAAVLAAGLIGGFWFSRRAIKPIEAMSTVAAEISLSNLSRRIDVSGTETELTGLARTLNQMIDRLESAFNHQVRFTADASHELRTPLAVILSHAELALDKNRPANELRETIETCRRSALRMKSVVESLLTLARFDSGDLQLDCRPVDLSRIAGDCAAQLRPLAEKRHIALELDLESAGLLGDPERMSQVVTNLLTNAIRYNRDEGRVAVTTRSSKNEVVLRISDTGIGIGPENLPHIFERFYRVDKARSRKDGGIGLGLAICKSIVEAHGGQITVTSTADVGTEFEVRLPKRGASISEEARGIDESRFEIAAAEKG
jgi:two-component system OmpR family sensor kinase